MKIQRSYIKFLLIFLLTLLPGKAWGTSYYAKGTATVKIWNGTEWKSADGLVYAGGKSSGFDYKEQTCSNTNSRENNTSITLYFATNSNQAQNFKGWVSELPTDDQISTDDTNNTTEGTITGSEDEENCPELVKYAIYDAYFAQAKGEVVNSHGSKGAIYVTNGTAEKAQNWDQTATDETGEGNYFSTYNNKVLSFGYFARKQDGEKFLGWSTDGTLDGIIDGSDGYDESAGSYKWIHNINVATEAGVEKRKTETHYALFTKLFTITYNVDGGSEVTTPEKYYYECSDNFPSSTKTGYEFLGWKSNISTGGWDTSKIYTSLETFNGKSGDVTLTAQWKAIQYNITYVENGGTLSGEYTKKYTIEDAITLPTITKEESVFQGWSVSGSGHNHNWDSTIASGTTSLSKGKYGSVTLTANFVTTEYTAKFNPDDGSSVSDMKYTKASGLQLPTSTKGGYTLDGWMVTSESAGGWVKGQTYSGKVEGKNADVSFKAVWSPTEYTVTYDANGGTVTPTSVKYTIESTVTVPTPTKKGCEFIEWKPTEFEGNWTGSETYKADASISGKYGNVTLSAQWKGGVIISVSGLSANHYAIFKVSASESDSYTISVTTGAPVTLKNLDNGKTYNVTLQNWSNESYTMDATSKNVTVSEQEQTISFTATPKSGKKTYETFREF